MIRRLTYDDVPEMVELIKTRDTLWESKDDSVTSYEFLENEGNFNRRLSFGLFEKDGTLDVFIFINIWEEMPVYSYVVFTKKRDNRVKLAPNLDKNLYNLAWYVADYMNKLGYPVTYMLHSEKWLVVAEQHPERCIVDIVERIPAGQLSKYSLFRLRLANKRYNVPVVIRKCIYKPEFRETGFTIND